MDIVATGTTPDQARSELNDLIIAQVDYEKMLLVYFPSQTHEAVCVTKECGVGQVQRRHHIQKLLVVLPFLASHAA